MLEHLLADDLLDDRIVRPHRFDGPMDDRVAIHGHRALCRSIKRVREITLKLDQLRLQVRYLRREPLARFRSRINSWNAGILPSRSISVGRGPIRSMSSWKDPTLFANRLIVTVDEQGALGVNRVTRDVDFADALTGRS